MLARDAGAWCRAGIVVWATTLAGCATAGHPADAPRHGPGAGGAAGDAARVASATDAAELPAGYGTLRQDDATVSLRAGAVLLKLTPLDEGVIRLLAPDTYQRLHALRESRADAMDHTMLRDPELFLVAFSGLEAHAAFRPEEIELLHQARPARPVAILPVSGGWGRQQLNRQETQVAIYVFAGPVDYGQPITVRYGAVESHGWQQVMRRLETERSRIRGRIR